MIDRNFYRGQSCGLNINIFQTPSELFFIYLFLYLLKYRLIQEKKVSFDVNFLVQLMYPC